MSISVLSATCRFRCVTIHERAHHQMQRLRDDGVESGELVARKEGRREKTRARAVHPQPSHPR